jgi:hypothetical protein
VHWNTTPAMAQDRNIKWVTFRQHLQDLMRDIFENARDTDCIVKVDGKEIYVHRAVLCASSDYFHFLIKTAPVFETPTLIIADYDYNLIKDIVIFIYTGEMFVENDRYAEFREACMNLGLKSFDKKKSHDTPSGSGGVISKKKIKREKDTLMNPIEEVHVEEIAMAEYEVDEEIEEEEEEDDVQEQKPIRKSNFQNSKHVTVTFTDFSVTLFQNVPTKRGTMGWTWNVLSKRLRRVDWL